MNTLQKDLALAEVTNDTNYRILLAVALEATRNSTHPVLEMGLSVGCTPYLHVACENLKRPQMSIEEGILTAAGYLKRFGSSRHEIRCVSWDAAPIEGRLFSVAILDHAPGERRWADALRLADRCQVIVLHDTEPAADYGYKYSQIWGEFKHRLDVKSDGAWASAVSKTVDLSPWHGLSFGPYVTTVGEQHQPEDTFRRISGI